MIERFVFVKLKSGADPQAVAAAALRDLVRVPVVRRVRVGLPADAEAEVWDLVLTVGFDRVEDVPAYVDDPVHVAFVEEHLASRTEVKKAWNFHVRP